jgi:hypothetical protein
MVRRKSLSARESLRACCFRGTECPDLTAGHQSGNLCDGFARSGIVDQRQLRCDLCSTKLRVAKLRGGPNSDHDEEQQYNELRDLEWGFCLSRRKSFQRWETSTTTTHLKAPEFARR